jgi:hypothetical protein
MDESIDVSDTRQQLFCRGIGKDVNRTKKLNALMLMKQITTEADLREEVKALQSLNISV